MPEDKSNLQSVFVEEFLFFFMRLQKCHCRHIVGRLKRKYSSDTPAELARRVINAQAMLSFTAGVLSRLPSGMSATSRTLRIIGIAGGAVVLSRMHISLILKIALVFGKDIDDKERVPEILAVIATTAPVLLFSGSGRSSSEGADVVSFATTGALGAASAYAIGQIAIRYYSRDAASVSSVK